MPARDTAAPDDEADLLVRGQPDAVDVDDLPTDSDDTVVVDPDRLQRDVAPWDEAAPLEVEDLADLLADTPDHVLLRGRRASRQFGCLPSQLMAEDADLWRLLEIERLGTPGGGEHSG